MKTRVVLVGGFSKAKTLARSLIDRGYHVSVINNDRSHCEELAEIEKLLVYFGDGTKPSVLEDANTFGADIAIALTDSDADNLVVCELCKKRFSVKKTAAVITDPKKTDFFYRMGIDSVICVVTSVAGIIQQQAFMDDISMLMPVGDGQIMISQVPIPVGAPAVDKTLMELNLPRHVIIGCIMRGEKGMIPRGDTRILAGDVLVLISAKQHEGAAVHMLTGR
ncbi:MAG: NAD-binding protein [Oscillospiraceae bacterium]|jgi:trk system potassium uptake protein TrkA|nr:NAD-binding protein [Oscillospiraceae bacterium]